MDDPRSRHFRDNVTIALQFRFHPEVVGCSGIGCPQLRAKAQSRPKKGSKKPNSPVHEREEQTMGFMDKLKGTAKQAVNPGGQMKERDKIAKINSSGVDATATVDSMQKVGSPYTSRAIHPPKIKN